MALRFKRFYTGLNDQYRQVMRSVGSCVSLITCSGFNGQEAGMTISSLSSVSMNPKPIISFNIQIPSRTSRILQECNGRFAVNIIPASSGMKELALAFAGRHGHDYNPFLEMPQFFDSYRDGNLSIPIVTGSHVLVCSTHKQVQIQDHLAIFAEVNAVLPGNDTSLMYINSRFHKVGDEI